MNDALLASTPVVPAGLMLFVIAAAGLMTLPATFVLLRLYRRAVRREMAGTALPDAGVPELPAGASSAQLARPQPLSAAPLPREAWRVARVYSLAGLAYAAAMAVASVAVSPGLPVNARLVLVMTALELWPLVIALPLVLGRDRRRRNALYGGYFATITVVFFLLTPASAPGGPAWALTAGLRAWLGTFGLATALAALLLSPRVRSLSPVVMTAAAAAMTGVGLTMVVLQSSDDPLLAMAAVARALAIEGPTVLYMTFLLAFIVGLGGGALAVRGLARLHATGRVGDQMLTVGSLFLVFALTEGTSFARVRPPFLLLGLLAFGLFMAVATAGFAWLRRTPTRAGPALLVLRVFALGRASRELF